MSLEMLFQILKHEHRRLAFCVFFLSCSLFPVWQCSVPQMLLVWVLLLSTLEVMQLVLKMIQAVRDARVGLLTLG